MTVTTNTTCMHKQNNKYMMKLACIKQMANSTSSLKNSLETAVAQIRAMQAMLDE